MAGMRAALVSADCICIACLLILLWGFLTHNVGKRQFSVQAYIFCLAVCILGMTTEALCCVLEGKPGIDGFLATINTCSLLGYTVITAAFMYYMWNMINEKTPVSIGYVHAAAAVCAADIAFYIFGCIFGYIFTVENGIFIYKKPAIVGEIVEVALLLYFVVFSIVKGRKAGSKILIAIVAYVTLPLLSTALYAVVDEVSFAYVAISLVLLIVYVMIQADEQEKLIIRESVLQEVSVTDSLTGINNRRAYDARIKELMQAERVGVLFCDLNGLKTVNDTEGHASGDSYIVSFSDMLRRMFREDEIFRISGDEFVILLEEIPENRLQENAVSMKKMFEENGSIASVGFACGTGKNLKETITAAEHEMYAEKSRYYITSGKDRRTR